MCLADYVEHLFFERYMPLHRDVCLRAPFTLTHAVRASGPRAVVLRGIPLTLGTWKVHAHAWHVLVGKVELPAAGRAERRATPRLSQPQQTQAVALRRGVRASPCEPQIKQGNPLNLSISVSGGKETNMDSLSNGE
jgi:hypothetical protein